ncbi:MAG: hypothetical protein JWQ23_3683 [Herminiimonas sp.]|nr:hypothetical protein [Herminiimonas sp.]
MKYALKLVLILCLSAGIQAYAQTMACQSTSTDGNQFVPSIGMVEVNEDSGGRYIYQWMYWHNAERLLWLRSYIDTTYEPDAFFYNYDGKAYGDRPGGYWASNMPSPYVDTQFGDPSGEKAVTIGSGNANLLTPGRWYYTVTRMWAGRGASSWIKLSSQRGVQTPTGCTSTWCSFGCDTYNNYVTIPFQDHFTVPGCRKYYWNYYNTTRAAC